MKEEKNKNSIHVHVDADAFFASVEQVLHRELKGRAVVVGQNGGIVTALSYPAKDLGISRVSPIVTVRKKYPSVKIAASDFNAYGIFSKRMDNIIRNHFPNLVKNSVDEGSVEMNRWVNTFDQAEEMTKKLQIELEQKLGCTFSFGIARSPLLAKLASGMNKPNGITVLNDENVKEKIYHMPVNQLSGIGIRGHARLQKSGIDTIGDFAKADPYWIERIFSVVMPAIQKQLLGKAVKIPEQKSGIKSMSRDRSFKATNRIDYLHSQTSVNIEHLAKRLRRENLYTNRVGLRLREQDLSEVNSFTTLMYPTRDPQYLLTEVSKILRELYQDKTLYRQVSVTFAGLGRNPIQEDLFGELGDDRSRDNIFYLMDNLEDKFGKSCISFASSLEAKDNQKISHSKRTEGDTYPHPFLPGEEIGKRLQYPYLGEVN